MKPPPPSEEAFNGWWAAPVTQAFREFLLKWETSLKDQWSQGSFQDESPEVTQNANAQALGQVKILKDLRELDYLQFEEALKDDE